MNKETVLTIIEALASEYSKNFSEKEITIKARNWLMILEDLTDDQIRIGLKKAMLSPGEFMPTAGKFREYCLSGAGSQNLDDEARECWATVIKVISRRGADSSPIFKDSAIAEAIRKMGGWKQLCKMLTEEETWRKKEFVEYYLIARRQDKEFLPMLRGTYKNYVFVGYDKNGNMEKLLKAVLSREGEDKQILKRIYKGVEDRKTTELIN